jgi:predicted Zn-ribbon and HTH transcriptional regulator
LCGWKRTGEKVRLPQEEWDRRAKALNLQWLEPLTGARTAKAKCLKCDYEWSPHKIVIARGGACPMCAGSIVTQDQWDERAHAVDLEWLEPVKSADTQTLAKCLKCGYAWKTSPNRVQQGGGCASCSASGGFNPAKPGFLYLMVKPDGVAQVGITGEGRAMKMRMQKHQRNGYELVTTWHFNDGADARNIEQAIINQWRTEDDLLPAAPEGEESWTETVHTDSMPLPEIVKRINALIKQR